MKTNEKEMDLKNLEDKLMSTKYNYRGICDVDFTPLNKTNDNNILLRAFIIASVAFVALLKSEPPFYYPFFIVLGCLSLIIVLYHIYHITREKFYLSNFSIKDLEAIKSNEFLNAEFKKHLVDNNTAVSAEFTKIAENYRDQLLYKIELISNRKEQLEREILIESIQ